MLNIFSYTYWLLFFNCQIPFLPQLCVNLDTSLVSVLDQTNVGTFRIHREKPAAKVSTRDHGGNTDLPQSFQNQLGQRSGVWDTVRSQVL